MAGKVAAAREALVCDLGELQRGYIQQVSAGGEGRREGNALMVGNEVAAAREALACNLGELQRGYLEQVRGRGGKQRMG